MKLSESQGCTMKDWNNMGVGFDQAYLSHYHTLEIIAQLSKEHGFFEETEGLHSISKNEYRSVFGSRSGEKFAVTTIVYVDSSTYTFVHVNSDSPVLNINGKLVRRLSNADIRRVDHRSLREREVTSALTDLGFIPEPPEKIAQKRSRNGGPVARIDPDGTHVLDYTNARNVKIGVGRQPQNSGDHVKPAENNTKTQRSNDRETPAVAGSESIQSDPAKNSSRSASHSS